MSDLASRNVSERDRTLHSRVYLYGTNAIVRDCVRQRDWESGRTHLSTGNKLTSRRKLASILWEGLVGGAKGRQVRSRRLHRRRLPPWGKGAASGGGNEKRFFAKRPEMRIRLGKTCEDFLSGKFIIHGSGFRGKCVVARKRTTVAERTIGAEETDGEKEKEKERTGNCKRGENIEKRPLFK